MLLSPLSKAYAIDLIFVLGISNETTAPSSLIKFTVSGKESSNFVFKIERSLTVAFSLIAIPLLEYAVISGSPEIEIFCIVPPAPVPIPSPLPP